MIVCPVDKTVIATDVAPPTRIEWCETCGTGVTVPPPARDIQGAGLFEPDAGYGGSRMEMQEQWFHEARLRLDWLARYVPSGRLLEIGSATGEFVAEAVKRGYDAVGLESSEWAVEQARQVTDRVFLEMLNSEWLAAHPEPFDAVAVFHVLEHVPEPAAFLKLIGQALHPGGVLLIEVPNGGSSRARDDGAAWMWARTEDHFHHFSPEGLSRLLRDAGYSVAAISPHSARIYGGADSPRAWVRRAARRVVRRQREPKDLLRATAQLVT